MHELRTYDLVPDLIDEYLDRADNLLLPIIKDKVGFPVVGFWRVRKERGGGSLPLDQERDVAAQVVWMIAWENMEERDAKWAELQANEDWLRDVDPKYYTGAHVKFMSATAASPLQ